MKKLSSNLANFITCLRIIFSILLLFYVPLSVPFLIVYTLTGVSDILDGFIARLTHTTSSFGAKLDSVSDFIFLAIVLYCLFPILCLPLWVWLCIAAIALIRFVNLGIAAYRFHCFVSLHTYLNKLTGLTLFLTPFLLKLLQLQVVSIILCIVAFIASMEELIILLSSSSINRDCKSFLHMKMGKEKTK